MADPFTIAQTGVDPITGSYLSSERRKAIFRSTRVSGFSGGGGGVEGERGGAIVVRPQTSLVDRAQNLQIQQSQQSVGVIQQSLDVINVRVVDLTNSLNQLRIQNQLEGAVEQKNLKDQQESERKLNERQIRQGRENLLERRIVAALVRPVQNIQKKVVGLFDRIMGAMTTLFFGWLTNQGIETLKAFTSGDSKKLEEIKNNVIKNVLFTIGAFAAIKIGFGLVMRTITGLTFRLAGLTARIALAPFRAAGGLLSKLFGLGSTAANTAGKVPITTSGGKVLSRSGNFLDKFLGATKNLGRGATGLLRGAGNVASKVFTPLAIGAGTYRMAKGDIVGGLLSYGSAIPGVGLGFAALDVAREFGFGKGTFFGRKEEAPTAKVKPTLTSTPPAAAPSVQSQTPAPPSVQPQTPATPQLSEISFGVDTKNELNAFSDMQTPAATESTSPYGMINSEGLQQKLEQPTKTVTPANIKPPTKTLTPVGTLPEPKPNIIIAGGGQDRTQIAAPQQQEPLTDVPFIPSGNTDNFYVLYSQLNYNVVM